MKLKKTFFFLLNREKNHLVIEKGEISIALLIKQIRNLKMSNNIAILLCLGCVVATQLLLLI